MPSLFRIVLLCAALGPLPGCGFIIVHGVKEIVATSQKNRKAEVDAELARFTDFMRRADYDSASRMFTADAQVRVEPREPIVGRVATADLFASAFSASKPAAYVMQPTSTSDEGEQIRQNGSYGRTAVDPAGRPVVQRGTFEAVWTHPSDGRWSLRSLILANPTSER